MSSSAIDQTNPKRSYLNDDPGQDIEISNPSIYL